jgi:hypothetical protein
MEYLYQRLFFSREENLSERKEEKKWMFALLSYLVDPYKKNI